MNEFVCDDCGCLDADDVVGSPEKCPFCGKDALPVDPPEHIETHPDGAYGMEGGW